MFFMNNKQCVHVWCDHDEQHYGGTSVIEMPPKVGNVYVLLGDVSGLVWRENALQMLLERKRHAGMWGKAPCVCVCTTVHMWQLVETQDVLAILSHDCIHNIYML